MDNEKEVLSVGSVVLGCEEEERFVGVVAGDHMVDRLGKESKEIFLRQPQDFYMILVLAVFSDYQNAKRSVFGNFLFQYKFPAYAILAKNCVVLAELKEEWALVLAHSLPKNPPGFLRNKLFGFNSKEEKALALAFLAKFYLAGSGERRFVDLFVEFFSPEERNILALELALATNAAPVPF